MGSFEFGMPTVYFIFLNFFIIENFKHTQKWKN